MITEKTIKQAMEQERKADAAEDLDDWLSYLPSDAKNLVETLRRAYNAACTAEPITALLIEKHLRTAEELAWQLALLASVRGKQ